MCYKFSERSGLVVPINILASDDIATKYRSLHYGWRS